MIKALKRSFSEILHYPSAVAGLIIILLLFVVAIYAIITLPYGEAIRLWRGGEDVWYQNPKYVPPAWTNYFRREKRAESFSMDSSEMDEGVTRVDDEPKEGTQRSHLTYTFDFMSDEFPQEMMVYFTTVFDEKEPFASISWKTPDGRDIRVADFGVGASQNYRFSQDEKLKRRLGGVNPVIGLFSDPNSEEPVVLKGTYQMLIDSVTFEEEANLEAEFILHGQVFGLAGTDHQRRDLMIPLLWGVPVALAFGIVAALLTSVLTMIIAAVGTWYGGWVDGLIQRITEVNLVLPFLPILIMVGTFYNRRIWTILGVTILLSIFTTTLKSYRAIFLQVRQSTYIEAARAYGANNIRIVFTYLIPRMIPLLIPALVSSVPAFVFLEASLALLGLGDPVLPTWGKIINDAYTNDALYRGLYYWIIEPAALLMITGLGFAMLGFSLDRIFNPRLREV